MRALIVVAVSFVPWERTDGAADPADGKAPRSALRVVAALAQVRLLALASVKR